MNDPKTDVETRLRRLRLAPLPDELKRRVMAAASLAPRASWRDRAWYSRAWRVAAACTLLAVVVVDRWSAGAFRTGGEATVSPAAAERTWVAAGVADMGVPAEMAARLTARAEFVPLTAAETSDDARAAMR